MNEIDELKQAEVELQKPAQDVLAALGEPLRFNRKTTKLGYSIIDKATGRSVLPIGQDIVSGVLWIPPFVNDFWSGRRKKPKPNKCICAACGNKHNLES